VVDEQEDTDVELHTHAANKNGGDKNQQLAAEASAIKAEALEDKQFAQQQRVSEVRLCLCAPAALLSHFSPASPLLSRFSPREYPLPHPCLVMPCKRSQRRIMCRPVCAVLRVPSCVCRVCGRAASTRARTCTRKWSSRWWRWHGLVAWTAWTGCVD